MTLSMTSAAQPVVGIGELLWDLLPAGPRLGGAVSNFSVMVGRLGSHAVCASCVGSDELGRQARADLANFPVDTSQLQAHAQLSTGTVAVTLQEGQPHYSIAEPVAWDALELSAEWLTLAERAAAVCFGTLAQRNPQSRRTIQGFLAATPGSCVRVFDINLRAPFYSAAVIEQSLAYTTLLKMNDSEMPLILGLLGLGGHEQITAEALLDGAHKLLRSFPVKLVCVTMGGNGSLLVGRGQVDRHPGIPAKVVDTVGAGDAFSAALTHYYLENAPLRVMNDAGNRWGSWVASQAGAMPPLDAETQCAITVAIDQVRSAGQSG